MRLRGVKTLSLDIEIRAPSERVWDALTNAKYAKISGAAFGKGLYIQSEWKLGSPIRFRNENDETVVAGRITELIEGSFVKAQYMHAYAETFEIRETDGRSILTISARYPKEHIEAQTEVWTTWLTVIKELSEKTPEMPSNDHIGASRR